MKILRFFSLAICLLIFSCHNNSFDSEMWKNWEENESNMRMRLDMTDDLINNHNLIGKSVLEIVELLGIPESNDLSQLRYNIGPCRGFGIKYGVLKIDFMDDKVIKIDKHCH